MFLSESTATSIHDFMGGDVSMIALEELLNQYCRILHEFTWWLIVVYIYYYSSNKKKIKILLVVYAQKTIANMVESAQRKTEQIFKG